MWVLPMQRASYKGVVFDVLSVSDSFERAVVEHAYPYVNGADIEDMRLESRSVSISAVFFGNGFYTDLKKFLKVVQDAGAGVLVHPILGRMPNMICVSSYIRHEAENVNYTALDLTFKEVGEPQEIFVFEAAILSKIDGLLNNLEAKFNVASDYWQAVMDGVSAGANWKARLLGLWGGLFATFETIRSLFQLDKKKYSVSSAVSSKQYASQANSAMLQLKEMVELGIDSASKRTALTFSARLRNVMEAVNSVKRVPVAVSEDETLNRSKTVKLKASDVAEISTVLDFMTLLKLVEFTTLWIEEEQESLLASELALLNQTVRTEVLGLINKIRQAQQAEQVQDETAKTTAVYETSEAMLETLRTLAQDFTALVMATINKKPPLVVKSCPLNGTIEQVAHAFYGDWKRADELLQLNPSIRFPNFISEGEWLNAYSV